MPKKTIYIRDEDMPIFEEAQKALDAPIGTIVINALTEALRQREDYWYKAFCLQMLNLSNSPILRELTDYMLRDMPDDIVNETGRLAAFAVKRDPMLLDTFMYDRESSWLGVIVFGDGFDSEYFETALEVAREGEKWHEEMSNVQQEAWESGRRRYTEATGKTFPRMDDDQSLDALSKGGLYAFIKDFYTDDFNRILREKGMREEFLERSQFFKKTSSE